MSEVNQDEPAWCEDFKDDWEVSIPPVGKS